MKQTMKRVLCGTLATALMLGLSVSALAVSDDSNDITISPAVAGHEYGLYQIFDGTISDGVLTNTVWGATFDTPELQKAFIAALKADTTIGDYFDTLPADADAQDIANVLTTEDNEFTANADNTFAFAEVVAGVAGITTFATTDSYTNGGYEFTNQPDGYYLIKDMKNVGGDSSTLYILNVVQDVAVAPKADVPTVEKKVLEDSGNVGYNDAADWDLYQDMSFRVSADLPARMWDYKNGYYVEFGDTFDGGFNILDKDGNILTNAIDTDDFTVYYKIDGGTETAFTTNPFTGTLENNSLKFTCENILTALPQSAVDKGVEIIIEYGAELNSDAVIGTGGNENEVFLKYSNDPYSTKKGETPEDHVVVFSFALQGKKTDAADKKALEKAEFYLGVDIDNDGAADTWAEMSGNKFEGWVTNDTDATTPPESATKLTSTADGIFNIQGLDSGTYYLREETAPAGYNKLTEDVKLVVEAQHVTTNNATEAIYRQDWNSTVVADVITQCQLTINDGTPQNPVADGVLLFTVENEKGSSLPSTGDTNKSLLYLLGAMIASACGIGLIAKKRLSKSE